MASQPVAEMEFATLVALILIFASLAIGVYWLRSERYCTGSLGQQSAPQGKGRKRRQRVQSCEVDPGDDEVNARWLQRLQVSESDVARIRSYPQRRTTGKASLEWLRFRRHRLTASRFSKAVAAVSEDCSKGDRELSRCQLIEEMLTQPEAITSPRRFGIVNEPRARESYVGDNIRGQSPAAQHDFSVEETGLSIYREEPWLAASPDGLVREGSSIGALEIKCCPSESRMYSVERIPAQFYDQMQGQMAILSSALGQKVSWCDFFVWSPSRRRCRRVPFDADYFFGALLPRLRVFYFGCYVPVARHVPSGATGSQLQRVARRLAKQGPKGSAMANGASKRAAEKSSLVMRKPS